MAHLEISKKDVVRIFKKTGTEAITNTPIIVCSECKEKVYAPPSSVKYKHCYNCGAKFDEEITFLKIKAFRNKMNTKEK